MSRAWGSRPSWSRRSSPACAALKAASTTIFLVDQNARAALAVADRAYVLETGRVVLSGSGAELIEDEQVKEAYLGL